MVQLPTVRLQRAELHLSKIDIYARAHWEPPHQKQRRDSFVSAMH
jgi:hypothetical protein